MREIQSGYLKGSLFPEDSPFISGSLKRNQDEETVSCVKQGWVCLDIGANYGYYSIMLSKLVGEKGHVVACEPIRSTFNVLTDVLSANGALNVVPRCLAIGDRNGTAPMVFTGTGDLDACLVNTGTYVPQLTEQRDPTNGETVVVATLDYFVEYEALKSVHFIKIDAQGADYTILRHGETCIRRYRPTILCEAIGKEALGLTEKFFSDIGYSCSICQENISGPSIPTVHIIASPK